jgi:PilZ domain
MRRIASAHRSRSSRPGTLTQRSAFRAFVHLPAWLTTDHAQEMEHVAFVRDISARGIFFYSDLQTTEGNQLTFVLEYLNGDNRVRLHLKGRVVRVEQATPTSATGIAVAFHSPAIDLPCSPVRVH